MRRYTDNYNTGSDLFPQKMQQSYTIVNGRVGIRGPDDRWSVELWAQNLFDKNYAQVAFNSPFQRVARPPRRSRRASPSRRSPIRNYPGGRQLFSMFLAEPRTFGADVPGQMGRRRRVRHVEAPPPPPRPAASAAGDSDLRGRIGDPGDRGLPGSAASASAAAAGARARLKGRN